MTLDYSTQKTKLRPRLNSGSTNMRRSTRKKLVDTSKLMTQRDCMRLMRDKYGYNRDKCVRGFVKAFYEGRVLRMRNIQDTAIEDYAYILFYHMKNQGW